MNITDVTNTNSSKKFETDAVLEKESIKILKHCYNQFKIDISFFSKLHENKINIYKLKSDYINLCSNTYINKLKVGFQINNNNNDSNIIKYEYPYINVSTVEINKKSFVEDEKNENEKEYEKDEEYKDKEDAKLPNEKNNIIKCCTENIRYKEENKDNKININKYSKKYIGILLNFNTMEEFMNAKRDKYVNYALKDLKNYLNELSYDKENNEKNKTENIYEDSFWEYKENELNFLEKINKYLILSYLDLKKCICYYSLANPIIKPKVDYKLITYSERIFFYIDEEKVYLNNEKRSIGILDLFYLSYKFDNHFNNYKNFINTNVFLLLKFDNEPLQNLSNKEYYNRYLHNMHNNFKIVEEEENKFYKINSFKELFEYLKDINHLENRNNTNRVNMLHKNFDIVILPLSCLSELKQDIKNSEDKILRYIKRTIFDLYICLIDVNYIFDTLGWDFRNFLYCFCLKYELYDFEIDIFAFRDISLLTDEHVCKLSSDNKLVWRYPICSTQNNNINCNQTSFPYVSSIQKIDYNIIKDNINNLNECLNFENDDNNTNEKSRNEKSKNEKNEVISKKGNNYVSNMNEERNDNTGVNNNKDKINIEINNLNRRTTMVKYILNSSLFKVKVSENFHFQIDTENSYENIENLGVEKIDASMNNIDDYKKSNSFKAEKENKKSEFQENNVNINGNILNSYLASNRSNITYNFRKNNSYIEDDKDKRFDNCEKKDSTDNLSFLNNSNTKHTHNIKNAFIFKKDILLNNNGSKEGIIYEDNKYKMEKTRRNKRNHLEYYIISGWKKYEKKIDNLKKQSIVYIINLNDFLNKNTIQRISVELNIKLIKWKILKDLKFEKIKKLKVLIIGLGTLGCMVARNCVSWGIQNFTFVDNSRVSYSNVSRQYLFTMADAECYDSIGEYKAIAAKKNLLKIVPDLNITAKVMDIPMPGHLNYLKGDIENTMNELDSLIEDHDVVFLLTDSKESRYFPCLLIAEKQYNSLKEIRKILEKKKKNTLYTSDNNLQYAENFTYKYMNIFENDVLEEKDFDRYIFYNNIVNNVKNLTKIPPLGVTVAIGFDSFLILRHSYLYFKAACYFCNDMHSPSDSLTNRTLDEKCTVTRGGVSSISSAMAVELLISLTQHPLYFFSPHIDKDQYVYHNYDTYQNKEKKKKNELSNSLTSCLGATPHIITFNLASFSIKKLFCDTFENCLCCSENVILNYQANKIAFIKSVICDSLILEKISNINILKGADENEVIMLD